MGLVSHRKLGVGHKGVGLQRLKQPKLEIMYVYQGKDQQMLPNNLLNPLKDTKMTVSEESSNELHLV